MTANKDVSQVSLPKFFNHVLPDRADQGCIFSPLLFCIAQCEQLGSRAWAVTLFDDGFRLNIGPVEVMSCQFRASGTVKDDLRTSPVTQVQLRILLAGEGGDCI